MEVCLRATLCNAQEFIDDVPLFLRQYHRRFRLTFKIDAFYKRKTAFSVNGKCGGERSTGRVELLIGLFKHLPQANGGGFLARGFKLVGEECSVVADFVYIETK